MWAIISMCYKRRGMFMHPILMVEYRLAASSVSAGAPQEGGE